MRNVSTFGAFTTTRLGIYAAQKGLEVTGNNITNINTKGYTRQRLDQVSFVVNAADKYSSLYTNKVGNGVLMTGVSQLRDPFLDIAYRHASANLGSADAKLAGLEDIAAILDEVGNGEDGNGVLLDHLQKLSDQLNQMITEGAGHQEYEGLVRTAAKSLVTLFNSYAKDLSELKTRYEEQLKQDTEAVNNILKNIRELNESIRKADVRGDAALELRDARNLELDKLSQYMDIEVRYDLEDAGFETKVEKLTITLANRPPHNHTLVDGLYAGEFTIDPAKGNYDMKLSALVDKNNKVMNGSTAVGLDDTDIHGSLQAVREMLTEDGEFHTAVDQNDPNAATKRGIPYYEKALNAMANQFARVMNAANSAVDAQGKPVEKPLFSNDGKGDATTGITAGNISISNSWAEKTGWLTCSKDPNAASGATDNLAHILAQLTTASHEFKTGYGTAALGQADQPLKDEVFFTGTFRDMFLNIEGVLANDINSTTVLVENYAATHNEVYVDRDSISGVDLNDEATSMMQYQKAYAAACRMMTTLDQALDKLINGTGVVGL